MQPPSPMKKSESPASPTFAANSGLPSLALPVTGGGVLSNAGSFPEVVADLREQIQRFEALFRGEAVETCLGMACAKRLCRAAQRVRQRFDHRFQLVVMGDFKRGKSTLINALLGRPLVTTNVLPETMTINRLTHGANPAVTVEFADGRRAVMSAEDLPAARLAPRLEALGGKPKSVHIVTDLAWLEGVELVDTPGLGDLFFRYQDETTSILPPADAVVYVISAISPLSESERDFLRRQVKPCHFSKLIFVINMIDCLETPEDLARTVESIRRKLHREFPQSPVFAVSALDETCRGQGLPRPRESQAAGLEAAFQAFQSYLRDVVVLNRDLIQVERAQSELEGLVVAAVDAIAALRSMVEQHQGQHSASREALAAEEKARQDQISASREQVRAEVLRKADQAGLWMGEFLERASRTSFKTLDGQSFDDVLKHYPFFLDSIFETAMERCLSLHQAELLQFLRATHTAVVSPSGAQNPWLSGVREFVEQADRQDSHWHDLDNLSLLVFAAPPLRFLGGLLTPLRRQEKLAGYREALEHGVPRMKSELLKATRTLYERLASELDVEFAKILQGRMEGNQAVAKQAQEIHELGEQRAQEVARQLETLAAQLKQTLAEIRDSRSRWQSDANPTNL